MFNAEKKIGILRKLSSHWKKHIASEICILQSTLSTALKNKEKLRASYVAGRTDWKRCREPTRLDVDAVLYIFQWFTATVLMCELISKLS